MICWLTFTIILLRIVFITIPSTMIPTKVSASLPIIAVSLLGTASSSTHCVIFGMYRAAMLATPLSSSASSILYLCLPTYFPAIFRWLH